MSKPLILPVEHHSLQSKESIRLLRILPGAKAEHVECKLIPEISLNDLHVLPSYAGAAEGFIFLNEPLAGLDNQGRLFLHCPRAQVSTSLGGRVRALRARVLVPNVDHPGDYSFPKTSGVLRPEGG